MRWGFANVALEGVSEISIELIATLCIAHLFNGLIWGDSTAATLRQIIITVICKLFLSHDLVSPNRRVTFLSASPTRAPRRRINTNCLVLIGKNGVLCADQVHTQPVLCSLEQRRLYHVL